MLHQVGADEHARAPEARLAVHRERAGLGLGDGQEPQQQLGGRAAAVGEVELVVLEAAAQEALAVVDLFSVGLVSGELVFG